MRFFINISGFETRSRYFLSKSHVSRFESYFLEVEREKMNLILTRIFEIDNSRYALSQMD